LNFRRPTPMRTILLSLICVFAVLTARAGDPPDMTPIKRWLARQDEFHSVQADFTQTRSLRALRSPVAIKGHLWFVTPDLLRWELGDPAKTIVIRKGATYFVIQIPKKKVERFPPGTAGKKGGMEAFAMMSFPLAKDFAEFNQKFETLAVSLAENRCHIEILPRDAQARKFLEAIKVDFDTTTGHLLVFEMTTRDGSSMRNEFSNVKMNAKIDRHIFDYDFTGFEVTDAQ